MSTRTATWLAWSLAWALPGEAGFVPGVENLYGAEGRVGEVVTLLVISSVLLISVAIIAGVLSLLVRFRRASGVERQQLKWFTYGAVLLGVVYISDFFYMLPVSEKVSRKRSPSTCCHP